MKFIIFSKQNEAFNIFSQFKSVCAGTAVMLGGKSPLIVCMLRAFAGL